MGGWRVVDAHGNVTASGPPSRAHMSAELASRLGLPAEEDPDGGDE